MTTSATRTRVDPAALAAGVRRGERASVARLLSLVESGEEAARAAVALLAADGGRAYTIGITGAPGVGKSSLTDRLVGVLRSFGDSVSVLAVDPSSPRSGGAILGDRVRMGAHATDPGVFIRSMATRGQLGGLAAAARQAIRVLDASGTPWIVVETVGVGQVEIDIAGAADTTAVVVSPGWGDGIQANKAGLLEIADVFVVNKADRAGADAAVKDLAAMLALAPSAPWTPPIVTTVATKGEGVDRLWEAIGAHRGYLVDSGELERRRGERARTEIRELVKAHLVRLAEECCRGPRFEAIVHEQTREVFDAQRVAEQVVAEALGTQPIRFDHASKRPATR
ncbi:MAG: methylmalonyl Co-A mutase-associated GTPase MeaB [Deltaproteobacteria bacterium]|nr:MAG: methylmalonyl Co-A mutase-associated GTPase MeaB [Deltaproteobacteria bacterium]